ncbi:MAG TPA: META domain-containing protein [Candidatus Nanopelagicales bacterium]
MGGDLRLGEPWYLVGGMAEELGAAAGATITFEGEQVGGQAPVNSWSAGYTANDDGAMELGPIAATLMAGPEAAMAAEAAYLAALDAVDGYTAVAAGELYLFTGKDNVLVYSVTPPTG